MTKMKKIFALFLTAGMTVTAQAQPLPTYLDETKPVEQRIEDALSRMTLDEKIAVIHAQSKFSSPGVKRLGFPACGPTTVLTVYVLTCSGTSGNRLVRPTTRAWPFLRSPV